MIKIKKHGNWFPGNVSTIVDFSITKYEGSILLGKQADVYLKYKNGKSLQIHGDEGEVLKEAINRIALKKNPDERRKFIIKFQGAWLNATRYGYSEYKKRTGTKNVFSSLDPFGIYDKQELGARIRRGEQGLLGVTPDKLIQNKLTEKNMETKDLADLVRSSHLKQKQSATYNHLSGESAVSREVAIEYGKILDADPVDLMFSKKTTIVWGKVNTQKIVKTYKTFIPGEIYIYKNLADVDTTIVPRDIYKENIKAISVEAPGTMYDKQIVFYYYSKGKEENCMNKLCIVGSRNYSDEAEGVDEEINYYFGIYENDKGKSNLINPDPFVSDDKKYILKNFDASFITPVVCTINPEMIVDETKKVSAIPAEAFRKEEELVQRLADLRLQIQRAKSVNEKIDKTQKDTDATHEEVQRILEEVRKLQEKMRVQQERAIIKNTHLFYNDGSRKGDFGEQYQEIEIPEFIKKENKKKRA